MIKAVFGAMVMMTSLLTGAIARRCLRPLLNRWLARRPWA